MKTFLLATAPIAAGLIILLAALLSRRDSPAPLEPVPPSPLAVDPAIDRFMPERVDLRPAEDGSADSIEFTTSVEEPAVDPFPAEMFADDSAQPTNTSDFNEADLDDELFIDDDRGGLATADPASVNSDSDPSLRLTLDQTSTTSTSLRNPDFPRTYISRIDVDLTSPNHWVRLTWTGPQAASQETGPFRSSPGRGLGNNNCDDAEESNRQDSNCTPKGTMHVQGFSNDMTTCRTCKFVTWFQIGRGVALHYYPDVPEYPASHGCVRLKDKHAAQLIHNNAKIGATEVHVDGKWTFAY
jgi:hypothetical protein